MRESREERVFRLAVSKARCSQCKGRILEIQRPKVVCEKCGKHYILAVQSGTFLFHFKLIEDTPAPAPPSPIQQVKEVKETITKEVVLIPCEYCRGLMPQTATFCPNCGAKRKG
jgi:hypothetical protein